MKEVKKIQATEARNKFFKIMDQSFLEKQPYVVEKRDIPMVYIMPYSIEKEQTENVFDKLDKLRASMPKTSDSVQLLKRVRSENA